MKLVTAGLTAILLGATPALADTSASAGAGAAAGSQSGASSELTFNSGSVPDNTPGIVVGGGMSTAPCVVGRGAGAGVPGAGLGFSWGVINKDCETREEAKFLANLLNMRPGPSKQAAIFVACKNDKTLQEALVYVGACQVKRK